MIKTKKARPSVRKTRQILLRILPRRCARQVAESLQEQYNISRQGFVNHFPSELGYVPLTFDQNTG